MIDTELQAGDILPSEREFVKRKQVSRTTVRQALLELERMGYIYKVQGKGNFVADRMKEATDLNTMYSFTDQMKLQGRIPSTKVLHFEEIPTTEKIAKKLELEWNEQVYKLVRLRIADEQAMMYETTYLPKNRFPHLTKERVEEKALYRIFEEMGHVISVAKEEIVASKARFCEAEMLDIVVDSAVLFISRKTYSTKKEVLEWTESIARADSFKYEIVHQHRV